MQGTRPPLPTRRSRTPIPLAALRGRRAPDRPAAFPRPSRRVGAALPFPARYLFAPEDRAVLQSRRVAPRRAAVLAPAEVITAAARARHSTQARRAAARAAQGGTAASAQLPPLSRGRPAPVPAGWALQEGDAPGPRGVSGERGTAERAKAKSALRNPTNVWALRDERCSHRGERGGCDERSAGAAPGARGALSTHSVIIKWRTRSRVLRETVLKHLVESPYSNGGNTGSAGKQMGTSPSTHRSQEIKQCWFM